MVCIDFLFSRCVSAAAGDDSVIALRRFDDIRRRKFLKLIFLATLVNDVFEVRSVSFGFEALGV
jgi:hypothetical protein